MIVGTSGKRGALQTLCKQLPELKPSPGKSSTAVQCRDRKQPRLNDACRARRLNMSPSKHAQDSLAPVNFAIRLRGKFSPASVTSMGCSHGPRCLQAKEVCAVVSPDETLQPLSWFWHSCVSGPHRAAGRRPKSQKTTQLGGFCFFFWLGYDLAWRNRLSLLWASTQQPRWHERDVPRRTAGAKISKLDFAI